MHCSLVGHLCRKNKIFFHTDAAQAVGKIPLDVNELKIDLMSISGHKIYGPKGMINLFALHVHVIQFVFLILHYFNATWMLLVLVLLFNILCLRKVHCWAFSLYFLKLP